MESFSAKLKRAQLSTEVGEDGPALETVLEGPLLSAKRKKSLKRLAGVTPAQSLGRSKLSQSHSSTTNRLGSSTSHAIWQGLEAALGCVSAAQLMNTQDKHHTYIFSYSAKLAYSREGILLSL